MTSQVIYVIYCDPYGSDEISLESAELCFLKTGVSFRLPKLCLPADSRCAVINGFIYVLNPFNGDMNRLEERNK